MAGIPAVAHAQDVQASVRASVGGSAETNPYNDPNPGGAAVAATAEISPTFVARDDRTTVQVNGMAQFRRFFRRYGLEDNYSASAAITRRQTEWLTLRANSFFSYNEGGFNGFGRPSLTTPGPIIVNPDPTVPAPVIDPLLGLSDVNILGQRTRTTSYGASLGADFTLGEYSSLSLDGDARAMRFKTTGFDNYNSLHGEAHWTYQVAEGWSAGLIGGYGRTNYLRQDQGDAGTTDLLATVDGRLGARWTVSLSLGESFTTIDGRGGRPDIHYSSFSTRARICQQGEFSQFCLGAQRSPQPTANGGVRVSTTINGDYSIRVSERERVSLSGSYAKTGRTRDLTVGGQPAIDFVTASARYDNQIDQRLTAFVSTNFSKTYSSLERRKANVGIAIGLQYSFGVTQ